METLPPIPTPPSQRWREFRIQILPLIVFVAAVLLVALLWRNFVQPVGVIGEVEAVKANLTSIQDGLLTDLTVDLLQPVKAGDVIGHVQVASTESIRAELATLTAELRVTAARSVTDERRRIQDLEALRMQLFEQQAQLASELAQLPQLSNSYVRLQAVYLETNGVFSADEYDMAESAYKTMDALVRFRTALVDAVSKAVQNFDTLGPVDIITPIEATIKSHEEELNRIYESVSLRAPIDGTVSAVFRRRGERIVRGEPLVTISATRSERIVGYLRQPFTSRPSINDEVLITTRSQPRRKGSGHILNVGSQIELVRPGLFSTDSNQVDSGLPILVSIPPGLEVIPGELVDLSIKYAKN